MFFRSLSQSKRLGLGITYGESSHTQHTQAGVALNKVPHA
jgi:hypothetical protein